MITAASSACGLHCPSQNRNKVFGRPSFPYRLAAAMGNASVTGLAGGCGNIINLAAKCLDRLSEARKRFQTANFTTTILISNLSTLKAALAQVQRWMSIDTLDAQHYQMIMDVDAMLTSCHSFLAFIDERISRLSWDS